MQEEDATNEEEDEESTIDQTSIDDFNLADFDWSFGLFDSYPGLEDIVKIGGPFQFTSGFLNGTQFLKDEEVLKCE